MNKLPKSSVGRNPFMVGASIVVEMISVRVCAIIRFKWNAAPASPNSQAADHHRDMQTRSILRQRRERHRSRFAMFDFEDPDAGIVRPFAGKIEGAESVLLVSGLKVRSRHAEDKADDLAGRKRFGHSQFAQVVLEPQQRWSAGN